MKKLILMGMLLCAITSCSLKERPLNDNLVIYEENSIDKRTVFLGVKDFKTDTIVIKAGPYVDIITDGNIINCIDDSGTPCVYKLDGTMLGRFDTFTHWTDNGDYYLGTDYNKSIYYFPQNGDIVRALYTNNFGDYMFIETEGSLEIRTPYGEIKSTFAKPLIVIREKGGEEKISIAQQVGDNFCLYDINKKELKTLTLAQLRVLQKQAFEFIFIGCNGVEHSPNEA